MSTLEKLATIGQDHVLQGLDAREQGELAAQLEGIDLDSLPALIDRYVMSKPEFEMPADVQPATYYPLADQPGGDWDRGKYRRAGEDLIRAGRAACFTVAGGQGSRLGYDGPKGCYPAGAVTDKPLFQIFAEGILAANKKHDTTVPWYIMTSPLNHEATVAFFEQHSFFGLGRDDVMFFPQGTMVSFDYNGKILLADRTTLATNPDGHGGAFAALYNSGAVENMKARGVEHLSYFQVDNPLVRVVDPVFLGLHASAPDSSGQMSSKMCAKAYPEEKVGMFCESQGRTRVIEYSDMPADRQAETDSSGNLRFNAGSIAIHILGVEYIERVNTDPAFGLPWHRAEKKIPHYNPQTGEQLSPSEPNGVKLERFVFDALPMCDKSLVLETDRVEEFGPIKNAEGIDSAVTSRQLQTERAARWLEARGHAVPRKDDGTPDCTLEISPLTATCPEELPSELPSIQKGGRVTL